MNLKADKVKQPVHWGHCTKLTGSWFWLYVAMDSSLDSLVNLWLLEFNEIDDDDDQLSVLHRQTYTCRWSANHASVMEWNEKVRWNKTIIPKCEPVCCQSWPIIHMMILGRLNVWATSNPEAKLGSGCRQSVCYVLPFYVWSSSLTLLYFTFLPPVGQSSTVHEWGVGGQEL